MMLEEKSSSLTNLMDYYNYTMNALNFSRRSGIEDTIKKIEEGKSVIFTAPTGYGKTTMTEVLALAAIKGNEVFDRVIHVLPLRSIVQDLYRKLIKNSEKLGIDKREIAAQDMDFTDSPYFLKKVNITTLDTFILNLFKVPVAEIKRVIKGNGSHFEIPRAMIYSSIVIFDEFHLFSEEGRPLTSTIASLRALNDLGVPFIIMTATLSENIKGLIKKELGINGNLCEVNANDFSIERKISVDFIDDEKLTINQLVEKFPIDKNKKTLIVFNTRKDAIEAYKILKHFNPLLLHSKFNKIDRTKKIESIDDYNLVISTQVIEAGIDKSFDRLITEAAPASSIIQRAGRVARYGGYGEVIIFPFRDYVYDRDEVNETLNEIRKRGSIDQSLMSVSKEHSDLNPMLLKSLELIDDNVLFSLTSRDLIEEECNLTREVSLVMGFPPECYSVNCAIPLTEEEALKELEQNKRVIKDGKEEYLDAIPRRDCISIYFLKKGIDGIVIKGYDETGGIL
ncbi:MAG: CRISPR-associated helicase Cas3' [Thermocladium sp.]